MEEFREIKSLGKPSLWRGFLLFCGISSVAAALLLSQQGWLMFAVLPITWFVLSFVRKPAMVTLLIDEGGISVREQAVEIRFEDLQSVTVNGCKLSWQVSTKVKQIEISHRGGVLVVPCPISVPALEFVHFLEKKIRAEPQGEVISDSLAEWRAGQIAEFGNDRVVTFGQRAKVYQKRPRTELTIGAWAFALSGVLWVGLGSYFESDDWVGLGIAGIVFALFLGLFALSSRAALMARVKAGRGAGLVVSPAGIALEQAGSVGQLGWDAILDIGQKSRSAVAMTSHGLTEGLQLKLAGTVVVVHDVFELPLSVVEARLREFWRPA